MLELILINGGQLPYMRCLLLLTQIRQIRNNTFFSSTLLSNFDNADLDYLFLSLSLSLSLPLPLPLSLLLSFSMSLSSSSSASLSYACISSESRPAFLTISWDNLHATVLSTGQQWFNEDPKSKCRPIERDEQKLQRSCCHLAANEFISKASDATFRRKVETVDVQFSRDP